MFRFVFVFRSVRNSSSISETKVKKKTLRSDERDKTTDLRNILGLLLFAGFVSLVFHAVSPRPEFVQLLALLGNHVIRVLPEYSAS